MPVQVVCPNPDCQASFSLAPGETRFRRCPQCGSELSAIADPGPGGPRDLPSEWAPRAWPSGLAEGATFAGRYRIIRQLGRGGMGAVYLAHDAHLDRPVALKVPLLFGDDDDFLRREARSAAGLHHPNICPIYDVGEHDGQPYLTMAYIDGTSLAEYLKQRAAPLDPAKAVRLARMLALALQQAHEAGVVHRDLKPSNIMLSRERRPFLMDFGLARRDDPEDSLRTRTGQAMGTPAYMPLEQFRGDVKAMGPRCDIYSLGVILFQLLTGRLPYVGTPASVLEQLLTTGPPAPSLLRPGLDPALEVVCLKAMAKAIEDRFDSMREFAAALGDVRDGLSTRPAADTAGEPAPVSGPVTGREPSPSRDRKPRPDPSESLRDDVESGRAGGRDRWLFAYSAALAAVALLGVVIYVATDKGTVTITGTDPAMVVRIDGDEIEIRRLGEPITIRTGIHRLFVTRGELLVKAESFEVRRGRENVLDVTYAPKAPPKTTEVARGEPDPKKSEETKGVASEPDKSKADLPKVATAPPPPGESEAKPVPLPTPPREVTSAATGMKLVLIEPGTFLMGSSKDEDSQAYDDEMPRHEVRISRAYYLGVTEVTQGQYRAITGESPSRFKGSDDLPVEQVSWHDAVRFCNALSAKEGLPAFYRVVGDSVRVPDWKGTGYRLPTEAEWEYACRAGSRTRHSFGDDAASLGEFAWFDGNSGNQTHPVGRKRANRFDVYDMHGNVWEWCWDGYEADYYRKSPTDDPPGPSQAPNRVIRGGGWINEPRRARSACRNRNAPENRDYYLGFRVARVQSDR
jgi:formylglycine-generating enzyme required for sulfatase activity/serine/threonine protein kinase